MCDYFDNYDSKYPEIVLEILDFFDISNDNLVPINEKTVSKFCEIHKDDRDFSQKLYLGYARDCVMKT